MRVLVDAVIAFAALPPEVVEMVVDKFVLQLEAQLGDRGVLIELTDEARKWLATEGYDERMGARPLARVIQEHVKKPIADEVLFGRLQHGGTVRVAVGSKDGKPGLVVEYFDDKPGRPKTPEAKAGPRKPRRRHGQKRMKELVGADADLPRKSGSLVPKVPLSRE